MKLILLLNFFAICLFSEHPTTKEIVKNSRMFNLPKIANEYNQEGILYAEKKDYKSASEYYSKSLDLKKEIGLEKSPSYAETLKLKAISEHKLNNSCFALKLIKEANQINEFLAISNKVNQSLQKDFESSCK